METELNRQRFILLPEKALYKPDEQLLIIADVHLGKAAHFRKEGIPISSHAQQNDYLKLHNLLCNIKPEKVYFLGDLFHSKLNNDWQHFTTLLAQHRHITFTLIKGNHDIITPQLFEEAGITVVNTLETADFIYAHEPQKITTSSKLTIAGHIHPAIVLSGAGKQSLRLPCFHITQSTVVLPAFGTLTGLFTISPGKKDRIYAVLPNQVIKVQ